MYIVRSNTILFWHRYSTISVITRERFFADSEFWRSSLPLKDVRNAQDEIFRLILHFSWRESVVETILFAGCSMLKAWPRAAPNLCPSFSPSSKTRQSEAPWSRPTLSSWKVQDCIHMQESWNSAFSLSCEDNPNNGKLCQMFGLLWNVNLGSSETLCKDDGVVYTGHRQQGQAASVYTRHCFDAAAAAEGAAPAWAWWGRRAPSSRGGSWRSASGWPASRAPQNPRFEFHRY